MAGGRLSVSLDCFSVFGQSAKQLWWLFLPTFTAGVNEICEVPGHGGTDAPIFQVVPPHCAREWGSVVIRMPAQLMVAGGGQFLSLAQEYVLGFPTLNPTFCHILSQWRDSWVNTTYYGIMVFIKMLNDASLLMSTVL